MFCCPHCMLSKASSVLHVSLLPHYQQWVPMQGHPGAKGKAPVTEHPGWPNPWRGCYVEGFSCKGDREWQLLREPGFHSCETTRPSTRPAGLWLFLAVLSDENSHSWNVHVPQLPGCSYHVGQCISIFSAGTLMDMIIELSGRPDLYHLYFKI